MESQAPREIDFRAIGRRIRDNRKRRGISQESLGWSIHKSGALIGQIERGETRPTVEDLIYIADELGVSANELLIGNQDIGPDSYQYEIDIQMADCTKDEQLLLYEMVVAIKKIIRTNRWQIKRKNE